MGGSLQHQDRHRHLIFRRGIYYRGGRLVLRGLRIGAGVMADMGGMILKKVDLGKGQAGKDYRTVRCNNVGSALVR
jgi:hypothetical protein